MEAEARGQLSELNVDGPLFVGGVSDWKSVRREAGLASGLNGALQRLVVNGEVWDNLVQRALRLRDVQEFGGPPCQPESPCQNGATCLPQRECHVLARPLSRALRSQRLRV